MGAQERVVDHAALAINQASIITLVLVAFVADQHWLVAAVAVIMLAGTAVPALAVFKQLYRRVLRPLKLVVPRPRQDNPEPHAFSQLLGGVFLAGSYAALWLGAPVLGWLLAGVVVALASLNLFAGFCAGCFLYYQLNRLRIPGFGHGRVAGQL